MREPLPARTHYQHPIGSDGLGWCYATAPIVTSDETQVDCGTCRNKLRRRDRRNSGVVARINQMVLDRWGLAGGVLRDPDGEWMWEIWRQGHMNVLALDKFLPDRQAAVVGLAEAARKLTNYEP